MKTNFHVKNAGIAKVNIQEPLKKLSQAGLYRLKKPFDWVYMVAKEELPFLFFLVQTEIKLGIDKGKVYITRHHCAEFVDAIGETKDETRNNIQKSPFYYNILFDGSIDTTLKERQIILIKFLKNKHETKFLALCEPIF